VGVDHFSLFEKIELELFELVRRVLKLSILVQSLNKIGNFENFFQVFVSLVLFKHLSYQLNGQNDFFLEF